jgi:hypothetical protein
MRLTSVKLLRPLVALALAAGIGIAIYPSGSHASSQTLPLVVNGKHVLWSAGNGPAPSTDQASSGNLIYHGGLVETTPAVYLVFWGPEWKTGFSYKEQKYTYTNTTAMNYLTTFFKSIGGSPWAGVQTQYCQNIDPASFDCKNQPFAQFIQNPKNQLKSVWVDPSAVPSTIATTALAENATNDPIATEALAAAQHFGYDINATYFILTQPGITATAYGTVYCAYHGETGHTTGHGVRYAFVPFTPEQGSGCGNNSVNATNNAFGNGFLDGYTVVAGHEFEEAVTDPDNQMGTQDGWNDVQTSETGDKCAWTNLKNITLGSHKFAVQPLWSNEASSGQGACAFSR